MKRLALFLLVCLLIPLFPNPAAAATLRNGEKVTLSESERLENVYTFGQEVTSNATVSGDLVAAGGNITIQGVVTGSILAAGGNITIAGTVGNSVRVAGGDVTISGKVAHDVVVVGGTVTIDKSAVIGGDILFAGGTLDDHGLVKGNVQMAVGDATFSSLVGGSVLGNAGTLLLQNGSEITGDLNYTSSQRAVISDGAIVHGQEIYHAAAKKSTNPLTGFLAAGTLLKLVTDILFALLLTYLLPGIIRRIGRTARRKSLKSGLIGLGFLLLIPFAAIILLLIIWLGLTVWLLYFLFLILALMVMKILVGWYLLSWWYRRNKGEYVLDWKAAVLGPLILLILFLIPGVGWLIAAVLYLVTLGALVQISLDLRHVTLSK